MSFKQQVAAQFPLAVGCSAFCFGDLSFDYYFRGHDALVGSLALVFGALTLVGILLTRSTTRQL